MVTVCSLPTFELTAKCGRRNMSIPDSLLLYNTMHSNARTKSDFEWNLESLIVTNNRFVYSSVLNSTTHNYNLRCISRYVTMLYTSKSSAAQSLPFYTLKCIDLKYSEYFPSATFLNKLNQRSLRVMTQNERHTCLSMVNVKVNSNHSF